MEPTIATPWAPRSKSSTAPTPRTTAASGPGIAGATRGSPNSTASDPTPTRSVRPSVSSRLLRKSQALSKK